ncbi:MAG: 3-isopropylmalate dehydrogenase [Chloroflexota bacterium]
MTYTIVVLPGDGIGPEVTQAARQVLDTVAGYYGIELVYKERLIGGCAIDELGTALDEETLKECQQADAVLLGAVGGPKWDDPAAPVRPEQGLLALRRGLGVFANLRPVRVYPALVDASPLRPEKLQGVDLLVVRELTGGLYFGEPKGRLRQDGREGAVDSLVYWDYEIERVVDLAFRLAAGRRGRLASVDKANVLETSRLWRQIVQQVSRRFPQVQVEHVLVDTAAMRLVSNPAAFDVIVTENMFGDILTDEAAVLAGSMGLLPSASLGGGGGGLYEPIHGSAPDIAGQGIANPLGAILSVALLLRYALNHEMAARAVEMAVERALQEGCRTRDLGGSLSSEQMTAAVLQRLTFDF